VRATLVCAESGRCASTRVILLPGAYQGPEDLINAGFARAVREAGLAVDLQLVDLELKHVTDRSMLEELHEHLVPEARAAGCCRLWLAGISLGGFLALLYAERHPEACDGLLLLAPYLGNRMILSDPERYLSSPAEGEPESPELAEERRVWGFIRQPPPGSPPLRLGFGSADRFAAAHRLMARSLPPAHVDEVPGGHEWEVWRQLWKNFLPWLRPLAVPVS
jgi:pimeloyl-ACP methyl ester carboxylesterase